jgi:hypothetical protein
MSKEYQSKIYDKCPFCDRPYRKRKNTIDKQIVKKWLDNYFNS